MSLQKNYDLYQIFFVVFESKSYSQAAELLHYNSHTTISKAMESLAKQVGMKELFSVHSRGVRPTKEAIDLYEKVKPLLAQIDFYEENLLEFNEKSSGTINIVYTTNFTAFYLSDQILKFHQRYPRMEFNLIKEPVLEVAIEMMKRREIDLIISGLPLDEKLVKGTCDWGKNNLTVMPLEKLTSTFYANWDLAKKFGVEPIITPEKFEKLPYVAMKKYAEFKKAVVTVDTFEASFQLVKRGLGAGLGFG